MRAGRALRAARVATAAARSEDWVPFAVEMHPRAPKTNEENLYNRRRP
jgi:hypothetical protein